MEHELHNEQIKITIRDGQLSGLLYGGRQWMHNPADPGWGHSDAEMFPIIGPTAEVAYRVQVPRGNALMDQHGFLRDMPYELLESGKKLKLGKEYPAGTPVANPKFPDRSTLRMHLWPYSCSISKTFKIQGDTVRVDFEISGERDMPYMLGYHPAFALKTPDARIIARDQTYSITEIMAAGNRALQVADCSEVTLEDQGKLHLRATGFRHFMLWSPDPGMVCIEPVTFYPYDAGQSKLHEGFDFLTDGPVNFSLELRPEA
ncbi:Aldose 1-epimerase [Robiginitalea myxolifaciens]|uniref:Aldose 1-epimerase n=1 Tax=Robiginitalea myxolifaciens TaxID=400055 RepID=A0A1I6HG91_9FLAO|nr:hypothetical protein [Robiginitalea myxolifaciens]SFR53374.1 Aldose 1-epimerase [Robiginitalea myxolifaciens]